MFIRRFAEFTGGRLSLAQVRLEAGARCTFSAAERETLLYCINGEAQLGLERLRCISSVRLLPGEEASIEAVESSEFYLFGLMRFDSPHASRKGS